MRTCGVKGNMCTLCCKLLPITADSETLQMSEETAKEMIKRGMTTQKIIDNTMKDFDKPAGARCPFQRTSKGCKVYKTRPFGCRFWSCRWVVNDDTGDLDRPDHSHYVIDMVPDFVRRGDTNEPVPVIQIWVDPDYPDAHKDHKLREYLKRRAKEGYCAIIRYNERDSMFLYYDEETNMFFEKTTDLVLDKRHSAEEFAEAFKSDIKVVFK